MYSAPEPGQAAMGSAPAPPQGVVGCARTWPAARLRYETVSPSGLVMIWTEPGQPHLPDLPDLPLLPE